MREPPCDYLAAMPEHHLYSQIVACPTRRSLSWTQCRESTGEGVA